jgi:hypothetical protein
MASLNDIASWGALNTQGFSLPSFSYSVGGKAVCVSGMVDVPVIATTFDVLYKGPANNYELTEFITGFFRRESDILATSIGDSKTINSTFAIYTKLCLPADLQAPPHRNSVQFLTHGGTLDHTYWEFAPEYSYVDVAAAKGFATFSYDRLGAAKSAHADPWQHLQMSVQKDIAHKLIQMLRSGNIGGITFRHIVGVGHSLGAALTQAVSGDYPSDFDAIALTGHSAFSVGASTGFAAAAQQIANTLPDRPELKDLPNGYYTLGPIPQTLQFGFFYYPHFDIESEFPTSICMIVLIEWQSLSKNLELARPMQLAKH